MGKITDIVKAWAEQQWAKPDLTISEDGNNASLTFSSATKGDFNYRTFCDVDEREEVAELHLYAPFIVPIEKRQVVAEVLARINFSIFLGRIDLNMDNGKLRFRFGIKASWAALSGEILGMTVTQGINTLDKYLPAISSVIYAGTLPAQAFAQAEEESAEDQTQAESAPEPDSETSADALPWSRIAGADLLQPWAQELQSAVASQDAAEWRDVGRAVLLVADDEKRCQEALQRVAQDAGMRFVAIESEDVIDLPPRAAFATSAPALIFLEPGRWLLDRQKGDSDEEAAKFGKFQQRLVKWINAFDPTQPVVLCSMVFELGDMADTLDGPERFDRYFVLPALTHAARGAIFIEKIGSELCGESITLSPAKLGKLLEDKYQRNERCELALLYLRRLSKRVERPLDFLDLLHMSTHGFGEEIAIEQDNDDVRHQTAVHEAGHAAMAILDSAGRNVPDYCSIVPGVDFKGVVTESIGYHQSLGERKTYADFRHYIRICLSGRAAEELVFGAERVSSGASGDLADVWKRSHRAFSRWGFAPQMEQANVSGSNLAVIVGDATPTEFEHVEGLIRQFLAIEYAVVLKCLADNQGLLNAITERLLRDAILDQAELSAICQLHWKHPA